MTYLMSRFGVHDSMVFLNTSFFHILLQRFILGRLFCFIR